MYRLKVKFLKDTAKLPTYGSDEAAGLDLYAAMDKPGVLTPGSRTLISTGISIELPYNTYGRIAPRSGLAYKHGIDVLAGVIDSDYRGEVGVILINLGDRDYMVNPGDRIAQLIVTPYMKVMSEEATIMTESERGRGGFGSTGS